MIGVAPTQSLMLKRWKAKKGGMPDEPVLVSPISRRSTPSSPAVIQMPCRQNSGELVTDCVVRPTNLRQLSFEPGASVRIWSGATQPLDICCQK